MGQAQAKIVVLYWAAKFAFIILGTTRTARTIKKCLCLEAGCLADSHKLPCVCNQSCTCTVYHCDMDSGCCDRKQWQKCRYYCVELCNHCDYLRRNAVSIKTYNPKTGRCNCECKCNCDDIECDGCCPRCETHTQNGWNLLTWQQFRRPRIFNEQPKSAPYYFENYETGERITTCSECGKSAHVMKQWDHTCGICFDAVCYKCSESYEHERTDSDCDGVGNLYWRFDRQHCRVESGKHLFFEK